MGRAQDAEVTLRYQNHWTKETDAHYEGMNWLYEAFAEAHPNIHIENILNPDSEESDKKILADCAAGDCPDIIHDANATMWDAGYLLDLAPYLDADPEWKAVLDPNVLGTTTTDGQIWALSGEVSPLPTIWNTRILEEAGVAAVPSDLGRVAGGLRGDQGRGLHADLLGSRWPPPVAQHRSPARRAVWTRSRPNEFDSPQHLEAFNRLKVFVDNGWVPDNEIELTWQQSVALFVAEQTAFYLNGAWTIGNEITGEGAAPDLKDNVAFAPYPAVGENGTTVEIKQTTGIGLSAALAEDEAKLEAAITFFKFWFSEEGGKQWILLTRSPMGVNVDLSDARRGRSAAARLPRRQGPGEDALLPAGHAGDAGARLGRLRDRARHAAVRRQRRGGGRGLRAGDVEVHDDVTRSDRRRASTAPPRSSCIARRGGSVLPSLEGTR